MPFQVSRVLGERLMGRRKGKMGTFSWETAAAAAAASAVGGSGDAAAGAAPASNGSQTSLAASNETLLRGLRDVMAAKGRPLALSPLGFLRRHGARVLVVDAFDGAARGPRAADTEITTEVMGL